MPEYAVIVIGDEVLITIEPERPMTKRGDRFWLEREPGGWVPATSSRYDAKRIPRNLMTFRTKAGAAKFMATWGGHPWWCKPIGHRVVEVRKKYRREFDHYDVVPRSEVANA